jgi:hypothetical protein
LSRCGRRNNRGDAQGVPCECLALGLSAIFAGRSRSVVVSPGSRFPCCPVSFGGYIGKQFSKKSRPWHRNQGSDGCQAATGSASEMGCAYSSDYGFLFFSICLGKPLRTRCCKTSQGYDWRAAETVQSPCRITIYSHARCSLRLRRDLKEPG